MRPTCSALIALVLVLAAACGDGASASSDVQVARVCAELEEVTLDPADPLDPAAWRRNAAHVGRAADHAGQDVARDLRRVEEVLVALAGGAGSEGELADELTGGQEPIQRMVAWIGEHCGPRR